MKTIELKNTNLKAIVDDDIFEKLQTLDFSFGLSNGYVVSTNHHKTYGQIRLHRFILNFPLELIDHKDGNPLNCLRENLRLCNRAQNAVNTSRKKMRLEARATKTSRYKGVYWSYRNSKWLAQIGYKSRVIYGGYYDSELLAAKKANELYVKFHGEFARLNQLEESL